MIALVPADTLEDALGHLPEDVRLERVPEDRDPDPAVLREAEFLVLSPRDREAFARWLPRMTALRVVQTLNAGVDWVPALPAGMTLCNSGTVHDGTVAEWVIGTIIAAQRDLPHYLERQRAGVWDSHGNTAFTDAGGSEDLAETSVLVVGHGSIGRALAARLAPFGTAVTGVARRSRPGTAGPEALPRLLPAADVVVLLAPATPETEGMVDEVFLARMRPGALLVNASRGSLVHTDALLAALCQRRVRAVLDATDPEPLPAGHPLWSAPGCIITPHIAGSSRHWRHRAYRHAGDQLRRYAAGQPLHAVREHGY